MKFKYIKTTKSIIFYALIVLFSISCQNPFTSGNTSENDLETGSLSIILSSDSSRTIVPSIDMTITTFSISGDGPGEANFSGLDIAGTAFTAENIVNGSWIITVDGKNESGTRIMSGSANVEIVSGINEIIIDLYPLTVEGSYNLNIIFPEGELNSGGISVISNFTPQGGNAVDLSFDLSYSGASCLQAFPAGYYLWSLQIEEFGQIRYLMPPEAVRIISNEQTDFTLDLTETILTPLPQVESPQFTPDAGTYTGSQTIELTCSTPDSTIRYSIDGSQPSNNKGTEYSGSPITVNSTTTIRAVAYNPDPGWTDSEITEAFIEIEGSCATPVFNPPPGIHFDPVSVSITSSTSGAIIMYTDDNTTLPSESVGTEFSSSIDINSGELTLMAIAMADVSGDTANEVSDLIAGVYKITGHVETPTVDKEEGIYNDIQYINLFCGTEGANIYYTIDNTAPDAQTGTLYQEGTPILVVKSSLLQAVAVKEEWADSPLLTLNYTLRCADPVLDTDATAVIGLETPLVSFSSVSPDVQFNYTLDGSTPSSTHGTAGMNATVSSGTILKVITVKDGWIDSNVISKEYISFSETITVPADNEEIIDTAPIINWEDLAGAFGYQIQIDTDGSFDINTLILTDNTLSLSEYQLDIQLGNNTRYYWHIRKKDSNNEWGDWSDTVSFIFLIYFTEIAGGGNHSLALKTDSTLWAAGSNNRGQLGTGDNVKRNTFTQVLTGVSDAACGSSHSLALKTDGTLWAAGYNLDGQLGTGDNLDENNFTQVLSGVSQIACGEYHSLALKSDGTLWGTGYNYSGQLGTGDNLNKKVFTQVLTDVIKIAGGESHSLALKSDGTLWSTGYNERGQLGTGNFSSRNTFTQVLSSVIDVACGGYHSLILKDNETLWTTGENGDGQLGTENQLDRNTFTQVLTGISQIACGAQHSLAIKTDGSLWVTGSYYRGQLGIGDSGSSLDIFTHVLSDAGKLSGGNEHSLLIKTDGTLWTTGRNLNGQLGLGDYNDRDIFTQIIE
ncbi:MAG: chitobiase/beta-hexosaminidase C-terminal domain-containing protein [Spirochaetales bacterium]|nr:chitobiase/beta-hexosaminidase C-terminal domain-containing protein [Spirochaetales bacterium]